MCGIAGWAGGVAADEADLSRMTDALAHRGPDATGRFLRPGLVALGFRRLSIIDLTTGDQPLANEDGTVHVTCNGEIYNFRELRKDLEAGGHRFRSNSDSEVIVHLYEEHGERCVDLMQGMFAIAIWDDKRHRLVLLRDRLGVKPLYWAPVPGGIAYASEPAALIAGGLVDPRPDPCALVESLALQYVPPPRTGFQGIRKLAPGERLVFEGGEAAIDRYWRLDYERKVTARGTEEVIARLDSLMADATRSRLVADVPLGAFLSGGIDSSLVVSYMAEALSEVRTFSIDFADARFSEGAHARRVANIYGTRHEEYRLEPSMLPLMVEAVRHLGEPFADSSAIPTYLLSEVTRRQVTVALSGDGGDEAFAGYRRYQLAAGTDRLGPVAKWLAKGALQDGRLAGRGRIADLRRTIGVLSVPAGERYAALMSHFSPEALIELCEPDFLAAAGGPRRGWDEVLALPELAGVDRYLALDTATYLPNDLLTKVDRMSMAHALEVRSPFLDYRVHEFAATLPPSLKLRRGRTKWPLKELAKRRGLPSDLVHRRKQGFGVPVGEWFRGELKDWMCDLVAGPTTLDRGYFRPEALHRLVDDHLSGRIDRGFQLWNLTTLELWHRTLVDHG